MNPTQNLFKLIIFNWPERGLSTASRTLVKNCLGNKNFNSKIYFKTEWAVSRC